MASYDELKDNLQALYDAAVKELQDLEAKRQDVLKNIEFLSPICGKKTYDLNALKVAESSNKPAVAVAAKGRGRGRKPGSGKAAKDAAAKTGAKKERVKAETLRNIVIDCLTKAYPDSLAASEISGAVVGAGLPNTKSLQSRLYAKLSEWEKEGVLERVERGVYRLVKKDA